MTDRFSLTAARLNAGLSRAQLARELGITRETLRRLENGLGVHPSTAKKVADRFDVLVTDLMPLEREAA
jgi:transcriptional regulator with XRE-family HTH domain